MKKVFLGLCFAFAVVCSIWQLSKELVVPTSIHAQPLPNCFLNGELSAVGTSPILDNSLSQNQCNTWVLSVFAPSTVTAYSIQLEGSGAGTFSPVIVSPSSGTNPCTVLTGCLIIFQGSYNQFRVNLTSLTGTGNISYRLSGASGITAKSLNPLGAAGGDLSGSYPNPTVAKVNGSTPGGTCTSQFVRSISSSAVPTCATVDNASLASPTVTVNTIACTLGGSCTIPVSGSVPLFENLHDITVSTSGTLTTLVDPSGGGNDTLPANYFVTGKTLTIDAGGVYSTTATPGTITLRLVLDGVTNIVASTPTTSPSVSQTGSFWFGRFIITCRAGGATGTLVGNGQVMFDDAGALNAIADSGVNGTISSFNLTATHTIGIAIIWSSSGNSITARQLIVNSF